MAERKKKVCSFCGRGEHDVKLLISGMNGYICDHCVAQAFDILKANHLLDDDGEDKDRKSVV